jgi:hypothetical protein
VRTSAVRLFGPCDTEAGAQLVPDSDSPTTSRLYEFTVGAASAARPAECASTPPMKWRSTASSSKRQRVPSHSETWKCMPLPGWFANGLGIIENTRACFSAIACAASLNSISASALASAPAWRKFSSYWLCASSWSIWNTSSPQACRPAASSCSSAARRGRLLRS